MNYSEMLGGSPVVPPVVVAGYFLVFLMLLLVVYVIAHQKIRPVEFHHRILVLVSSAIVIKLFVALGGSAVAAYWLMPEPRVVSLTPSHGAENVRVDNKIEIEFDRPVGLLHLAGVQEYLEGLLGGLKVGLVLKRSLREQHATLK